ncbi:Phosphoserine phosphatase, partial [Oxalobacteraceae bacterium IMCC9480]
MHTMNLILQGLTAERTVIESIAALAGATSIVELNAAAFRCEGATLTADVKAAVDAACLAAKLDYAFVKAGLQLSDFKLLAMDMDSTLITIECIDEIADMQGLKPQVSAITEAAMRGEIEFNESLTRRVALLAGLDASALQRVFDERLQLSPGAENMLAAVKVAGLKTLLVSGGFTFFTERIKQQLGLDYAHSNVLDIIDGKLTGRVVGGIVNAKEKKLTVARICTELDMTPAAAIVMGDGANDLQMMGIAGMSVAFRAKPV